MIDFNFIFNLIKENFRSLFFVGLICFIVYFFWDKIEYLWESEQGKREFFYDYHNKNK